MSERELPYRYQFIKCQTCGKEFLVERIIIGVDHTIDIIVSCKECLNKKGVNKKFAEKHPNEAGAIKTWLKDEG